MNHSEHRDAERNALFVTSRYNCCDAVSNVTLRELCVLDGSTSIRRRGLML